MPFGQRHGRCLAKMEKDKFHPEIMVSWLISSKDKSKLRLIPKKTTRYAVYSPMNIPEKNRHQIFDRTRATEPQTGRRLPNLMSEMIIVQDWRCTRIAATTSKWLENHNFQLWCKKKGPPNSPDLKILYKNLLAILEEDSKTERRSTQSVLTRKSQR